MLERLKTNIYIPVERLKTNIHVSEGTDVLSYGFYQHLGGRAKQEDYGVAGYLPGFDKLNDAERQEVFEEAFENAQKEDGQSEEEGAAGLVITAWRKKEAKEHDEDKKEDQGDKEEKLVVSSASLGDSRGIVVILDKNNQYKNACRANKLHSVDDAKERAQFEEKVHADAASCGGRGFWFLIQRERWYSGRFLLFKRRPLTTEGALALSGAFGDLKFDPVISHNPYVDQHVFDLAEGDRAFILAASDALTDGFSNHDGSDDIEAIGNIVADGIQKGNNLKDIASQLRTTAVEKLLPPGRAPDNATIILFEILPETQPNQPKPPALAVALDGHGGKKVAEAVQQNIVSHLVKGVLKKRIAHLRKFINPEGTENEKIAIEAANQIEEEMKSPTINEGSLLAMAKAIELIITSIKEPEKRAIVAGEMEKLVSGNLSEKLKGVLLIFVGVLFLGAAIAACVISHGGSTPVSYKLLPFAHNLISQGMEAFAGFAGIYLGRRKWKSSQSSEFSSQLKTKLGLFSNTIKEENNTKKVSQKNKPERSLRTP